MVDFNSYQLNIFKQILETEDNLIIEAVAGSGKTTTLQECVERLPNDKKILICAFNKSIKLELESRIKKSNVTIKTFHGFGYSSILRNREYFTSTKLNPKILQDFIKDLCYNHKKLKGNRGAAYSLSRKLLKLSEKLKNNDADFKSFENIKEISSRHGIEFHFEIESLIKISEDYLKKLDKDSDEYSDKLKDLNILKSECIYTKDLVIELIYNIYTFSIDNFSVFEDMVWLPVRYKFKAYDYDYIFVDEAQDLNMIQMNLIKTLIPESSRIIIFGDSKQAIYGFRGSMTDGMKQFQEYFNAKPLPLSICYRCPEVIIRYLQNLVPQIRGKPDNEEGVMGEVDAYDGKGKFILHNNMNNGDIVISRTNRALIKLLFKLMDLGLSAYIMDSDYGNKILKKIKKYSSKDINNIKSMVSLELSNLNIEVKQYKITKDFEKIYEFEKKIDFIESCQEILSRCNSFEDVDYYCNEYFGSKKDRNKYITLSSIHKAKGTGFNIVFILNPRKIPHPMAKMEWEIDQEWNSKYVAYSRVIKELYEVNGFDEPKENKEEIRKEKIRNEKNEK